MLPLIFGGLIGAAATAFIVKMGEGMIDVNGDHIHTNLAKRGELKELADRLTAGCNDNDALEIQKLFDYVTAIPYRSDHTSRHPSDVISSNWGDCDDKSNLFASLLQERGMNIDLFMFQSMYLLSFTLRISKQAKLQKQNLSSTESRFITQKRL
jgi:hypothetical protein